MIPIKKDYHVRYDCWTVPVACEITDEKCDPNHCCRHCNIPVLSMLQELIEKKEAKE